VDTCLERPERPYARRTPEWQPNKSRHAVDRYSDLGRALASAERIFLSATCLGAQLSEGVGKASGPRPTTSQTALSPPGPQRGPCALRGSLPFQAGDASAKLLVHRSFLLIVWCCGLSHFSHVGPVCRLESVAMAHETDFEPRRRGDVAGTAIVLGTALLGSGVLFAVLYVASLYLWR
jgi:hypothetical protein